MACDGVESIPLNDARPVCSQRAAIGSCSTPTDLLRLSCDREGTLSAFVTSLLPVLWAGLLTAILESVVEHRCGARDSHSEAKTGGGGRAATQLEAAITCFGSTSAFTPPDGWIGYFTFCGEHTCRRLWKNNDSQIID